MNRDKYEELIGKLGESIMKTKLAPRSNSARAKLFGILNGTIARHRSQIPHIGYVQSLLRETNGFDENEQRFQHAVSYAVSCIKSAKDSELPEILKSMHGLAVDAQFERICEQAAAVLEQQTAERTKLALAEGFFRELAARDRIHRQLARI